MNRNWIARIVAENVPASALVPLMLGGMALLAMPVAAENVDDRSWGDTSYELGRGWRVPGTEMTLAGYDTTSLGKQGSQPWGLDFQNLSLFLWWQPIERLKIFNETELDNALTIQPHRTASDGAYLALERLYADWTQSDALNLRIGKFLTPVGRWNVIHASPLVWTTSRPLITYEPFPTNATGAMIYGTLTSVGRGLDYSVYGSIGKELRPNPKLDTFREAYGTHWSYPVQPSLEIGLSFVNYEQEHELGERKSLVGADIAWSQSGYEIGTELGWRLSNEGGGAAEEGGFLQGVIPVGGKLYAVGRYEYFKQSGTVPAVNLWLLGLDYRYNRAVIFKSEYSKAVDNKIQAQDGFLASFAILF